MRYLLKWGCDHGVLFKWLVIITHFVIILIAKGIVIGEKTLLEAINMENAC